MLISIMLLVQSLGEIHYFFLGPCILNRVVTLDKTISFAIRMSRSTIYSWR